ncbi:MAG: hypothetical protein L6Q71_04770 [Planctomycetes bacterium]|nr:hypothetical protein [Planctomycetota bacterium]NUQ33739.1 hypothetical protein [Planctomycetaceae bacterium]
MHPEELRQLLERAIDGSLNAVEEAQLSRLLAKEPGLAAELERVAFDQCDADDETLDTLLARASASRQSDAHDLSERIIEKLGRRGRVLTMRKIMLGGGAVAAAVVFAVALFETSWLPSNDGAPNPPSGGNGELLKDGELKEPTVKLADGVTGYFDVQYVDAKEGVTIWLQRGSLLRKGERGYSLLGGQALIEVHTRENFDFFVDANRVHLRGPASVLVTVQSGDSLKTLESMGRAELQERFSAWLKLPHRDCTFKLMDDHGAEPERGSAMLTLGARSKAEELVPGEDRFVDGSSPGLDTTSAEYIKSRRAKESQIGERGTLERMREQKREHKPGIDDRTKRTERERNGSNQ